MEHRPSTARACGAEPGPPGDPGSIEYASWLQAPNPRTGSTPTRTASLYDRLGQQEGIARITRSLIDKRVGKQRVDRREAAAGMPPVEQHVIDFFCPGSGDPQAAVGKDMLATHPGTKISEREFVAMVDDAMTALACQGIDPATRGEVLAILSSLKGELTRV